MLPGVPIPLRLDPGFWWLARADAISSQLIEGRFEVPERRLFRDLLEPGMTVIDIGANAGIYTMTAARRVGPRGRVIAFEPSAREREQLARHLALNRIDNVRVESIALGAADGDTDFFIAAAFDTGFNSRVAMPGVSTTHERVPMCRLDTYADRVKLERVDIVKIDIEGGERDVLAGGSEVFRRLRPILLCEIEPARIEPWGYAPREIYDSVRAWDYDWFTISDAGVIPLGDAAPPKFGGNYLARPRR